jgi:hypothetical protein
MPGGRNRRRSWFSLGYVLGLSVIVVIIILVVLVIFPEPLDAIL